MSRSSEDGAPSSLDFMDPAVASNPQPLFEQLRKRCPVGHALPGGPVCISRYEDVLFALRHPEIFSAAIPVGLVGNTRPLIPLHIDPPDQVKYRKFLDPLFSRKKMLVLEDDVRRLAADLIDKFADDGECEFNKAFSIPYPCTVFLRMMGLPQEDLGLFLELKDNIIRPDAPAGEQGKVRMETGQRIYDYFNTILDEREASPKEDMLSLFLKAEVAGQRMTREDILDTCYLFLLGGLDTVTATLGCTVSYLAQHPERRESLVDNPSLITGAVDELLRWETPVVQVIRTMAKDYEFKGVALKAGDVVTLVLGSANTDDAMFQRANEVDFERESNRHIAFGGGVHRCLGSHLARMEMKVAIEELHRRIPVYAIKPGEQPIYSPAIREVTYLPLVFERAGA